MINLDNSKTVIETPQLRIYNNTLVYKNSVVQLSNITGVSVSPMEKSSIPMVAIIMIIAGLFAFKINTFVAVLLLGIGLAWCAYIVYQNINLGHYLTLHLNSGKNLYFNGKDDEFLKRIMTVIAECMNDDKKSFVVNMGSAVIEKMQVGDNNIQI